MAAALELEEESVLWFRARRTLLAGGGAPDAVSAARTVLGAQSQQLGPSLHALSLRTRTRPSAEELTRQILEPPRDLVRTWGQRETIHLYDPSEDWRLVVLAREEWAPAGRGGPMPSTVAVDRALEVVRGRREPITRDDLLGIAPREYVEELEERVGSREATERFAAGRLIWKLSLRGELSHAHRVGATQTYAARADWFPDLSWTEGTTSLQANVALTRRYLALHAPASAADVAHHFGARVGTARTWLAALEEELVLVSCGERKGLVALAVDADELTRPAPGSSRDWPLRLLPLWDTQLMSHADKSWIAPDRSEHALIWKKAAMVAATAIDRGRVVATWSHKKRGKRLEVSVQPLGSWRASRHAKQTEREAHELAAHLGLELSALSFEG